MPHLSMRAGARVRSSLAVLADRLECRPNLEGAHGGRLLTEPTRWRVRMLLSFERPAPPARWTVEGLVPAGVIGRASHLFTDLENCTVANVNGYHRVVSSAPLGGRFGVHRSPSR